jgi:hypothetical protein
MVTNQPTPICPPATHTHPCAHNTTTGATATHIAVCPIQVQRVPVEHKLVARCRAWGRTGDWGSPLLLPGLGTCRAWATGPRVAPRCWGSARGRRRRWGPGATPGRGPPTQGVLHLQVEVETQAHATLQPSMATHTSPHTTVQSPHTTNTTHHTSHTSNFITHHVDHVSHITHHTHTSHITHHTPTHHTSHITRHTSHTPHTTHHTPYTPTPQTPHHTLPHAVVESRTDLQGGQGSHSRARPPRRWGGTPVPGTASTASPHITHHATTGTQGQGGRQHGAWAAHQGRPLLQQSSDDARPHHCRGPYPNRGARSVAGSSPRAWGPTLRVSRGPRDRKRACRGCGGRRGRPCRPHIGGGARCVPPRAGCYPQG